MPKGCQCYLGPFGAKVLFFTSLIVILTTLHNLVVKPVIWRMLLPPTKLELEHDETIYGYSEQQVDIFVVFEFLLLLFLLLLLLLPMLLSFLSLRL